MSNSKSDYFDQHGLMYIEKNTKTENGIYYRAQLDNWANIFHQSHGKPNPNYDPYEPGWQNAIAWTIIDKNNSNVTFKESSIDLIKEVKE